MADIAVREYSQLYIFSLAFGVVNVLHHLTIMVPLVMHQMHYHFNFIMHAGKLQICFTAGLLQKSIRMVCDRSFVGYDDTLPPCSCYEGTFSAPIMIMWVHGRERGIRKSRSRGPNHIVPLVPNPSGMVETCHTYMHYKSCYVHYNNKLRVYIV